jgi:PAS domain S-box-containing protein
MIGNIALKYKLILGGVVAVLVPFLIAGVIIYTQLSNSLLEMAKEKSVYIAKDISALIESTLIQEIKLASAIASDADIIKATQTGDYRVAQMELEAIYQRIGLSFFTIFIADQYGRARADAFFPEQIGLDLSDRDYFLKAKAGRTSVSGPIFPRGTATPGSPIIVVCVPIQDKNEFLGVVALAFDTDFIENLLFQKKLGSTGYAYLINAEGLVLVHPRKDLILRYRLLDQPGTEELADLVSSKKPGTASYMLDDAEHIAGLVGVNHTDWMAAYTQSRDEIVAPVNEIILAISISGTIFLIVTVLIIVLFSGKISHPIHNMMEMMKHVTQYSTEVILQIGLDGKIAYANPAFEKLTGLKHENVIGTEVNLHNVNHVPAKVIWDALEAGTPWSGRLELKGSGPDLITLDVMLMPLFDDRGAIQGYLEIGRDVSAELMFENRLRQAQKLEAIGTLAGGIAHDFNNILSGIFGYAELSLMKMDPESDTGKYVGQILAAAERARDLVKQILTFSRKTGFELRPIRPHAVLKEALSLLRASIPATIDIRSKIESDSAIMAESTQLHQVVMNLFTNAVHAIGDNPGTINLELEDFLVDDEFTKAHPNIMQGKHITLRISDTGNGMDPETMDHIFEPFYTTKTQGQGTGLGLSVVHGIVNGWGGIITVYSEVGQGTLFNIIIPVVETADSGWYQHESVIEGGTERVAVIDDEQAIATTMESILTNLGYRVTAFTNGVTALKEIKANSHDFDLVITDHSMPSITGVEIARELNQAGLKIPVILTSGYLDKHMEVAAQSAGISAMIIKPVNTYQLAEAILRVLRNSQNG